ncbi:hypothetical protein J5X98_16910 [Leptothermofonsia sichuanensis E412]|uniref:hypothetical protein n=1 Tax=Leptothermofonsia sichuanensis TaxID=2917832 RepID=UPI001CA74A47|nr:hypothetical protein [Leptothermofonsia sichuanensis]QZZ19091.1 hypothetical protein J5X98_16910 [Leptothermofonsia sichuanensis E412]
MALSTRKRPRASLVKQETVGHAISFLEDLPEKTKEELSLREAVGQMQEQIKAALDKGYNYEEIAKMLSEKGIKISALTLKNYAPSGRRQSAKAKAKRPRKTADTSLSSEAASLDGESMVDTNGASASEPEYEATETRPRRGRRKSVATESKTDRSTSTRSLRSRKSAPAAEAEVPTTRRRRKSKEA